MCEKTLANLTDLESDEVGIFSDAQRVCSVDAELLVLLVKARAQRHAYPANGHQEYLVAFLDIASKLAGTRIHGFVLPATGEVTDLIMKVRGAFNGLVQASIDVYVAGDYGLALAG